MTVDDEYLNQLEQSNMLLTQLEEAERRTNELEQLVIQSRQGEQQAHQDALKLRTMYDVTKTEYTSKQEALEKSYYERDDLKRALKRARDRVAEIEQSFSRDSARSISQTMEAQRTHETLIDQESKRHAAAHKRLNAVRETLRDETAAMKREAATVDHERRTLSQRVADEEARLESVAASCRAGEEDMVASLEMRRREATAARSAVETAGRRFGDVLDRLASQGSAIHKLIDGAGEGLTKLMITTQKTAVEARAAAQGVTSGRNKRAQALTGQQTGLHYLGEDVTRLLGALQEAEAARSIEEARCRELERRTRELDAVLAEADGMRREAGVRAARETAADQAEAEAELDAALSDLRVVETDVDEAREAAAELRAEADRLAQERARVERQREMGARTAAAELDQRREQLRGLTGRGAGRPIDGVDQVQVRADKERELARLKERLAELQEKRDARTAQQVQDASTAQGKIRELSAARKQYSAQLENTLSLIQTIRAGTAAHG